MSSLVEKYAPFLATNGRVIVPCVVGCVTFLYAYHRWQERRRLKGQGPSGKPTDRDNFVFLDTGTGAGEAEEEQHPMDDEGPDWENRQVPYKMVKYSEVEMKRRSMEFYKMINERRTVRFFTDKPVPMEVVENCIRAAGTSPSGAHTEPWTYVVVSNADIKAQIRQIIEDEEQINYAKRMGATWVSDLERLRTNWEKPYLTTAPYLIIVFKQSYGIGPDGKKQNHYYNEISISISVGMMLCALQNAGLATVTSTPMNAGPKLREILGRPINEKVILLLPVGYPSDDATVPDLVRKPLKDIMFVV